MISDMWILNFTSSSSLFLLLLLFLSNFSLWSIGEMLVEVGKLIRPRFIDACAKAAVEVWLECWYHFRLSLTLGVVVPGG